MNEEKEVKRQLMKNMLLNLLTFSIIFYILGMSIYGQFTSTLYMFADSELEQALREEKPKSNEKKDIFKEDERLEEKPEQNENPRLVKIIRDENGEIIENIGINNNLNAIFKEIKFDKNLLGTIYEIQVQGYSYRGINYKNQEGNYIQTLVNVDSEKDISQKFIKNIVVSFAISEIVILIASYILSKKTLRPIIQSWKRQNQFVQDASHELRTPLTIIKTKQESLLEKPESKIIDNVEDISITLQETQRLTKLIKELMELAKSDSDKLKLNKEKFKFDEQMKTIIGLYKDVAKTEGKNLNINLEYREEIYADLNKLKEVLIILLDNSIKYTEKNDVIEVKTYKKDNKCVLEVIDTGIGISKEAMEHVFERFYREEKSRNRSKGGMGLGLSIAYNIVELHKGIIKFDKNREKGTRVIVKIPIK